MKTERGGDVNIAAGTKIGWIKHTVTLSEESPFVFGIELYNQDSSSLPYTIDYIQLEAGSDVTEYTTALWEVVDQAARTMAQNNHQQIIENTSDLDILNTKIGKIDSSIQRYNWYDPTDTYKQVASNGEDSRNGYTINADGSITCERYHSSYGHLMLKSTDSTKILEPNTYTISAYVTIGDSITSTDRRIVLRLGKINYKIITIKTERGSGSTIDGETKTGWVWATFEITEAEPFIFEIMP